MTGELTEIRGADLAFTLAETAELLGASDIAVDPETAETLWQRTEGWAAGLRLAALTMRAHPDPAAFVADFAGDDSTVADYLLAEVLAQQAPDVREFLLRISIVDATTADLADALTGRTDSARILTQARARSRAALVVRRTTAPGTGCTRCSPSCCGPSCVTGPPARSPSCTGAPPAGSRRTAARSRRSSTRRPAATGSTSGRSPRSTGCGCCSRAS